MAPRESLIEFFRNSPPLEAVAEREIGPEQDQDAIDGVPLLRWPLDTNVLPELVRPRPSVLRTGFGIGTIPAGPRSAATNDAIAQPRRVLARLTGCIGRVDYEPDESPFAD